MNDRQRQANGELYNPFQTGGDDWLKARQLCHAFNLSAFWEDSAPLTTLRGIFAASYDDLILTPPFYCDHGSKISFGKHCYANTGLTILDEASVTFGDHVFIGPHVSIYTASHPIDARIRRLGLETASPVTIGNDVWIGGNTVINPGVTIGNDVVIGSGSVVTKSIPSHVVAAGNPCRVIRPITQTDRRYWEEQYQADRKSVV